MAVSNPDVFEPAISAAVNRTPLRIAVTFAFAVGCWTYYSAIDGMVGRPSRARHKSPPALADDLAKAASATWRTLRIEAPDGVRLEAWLFVPRAPNGHAALVVHEMGGSRLSLLKHVRWLLRSGFICLVPDSRAHGTSGGSTLTYGIRERHDIAAWTNRLREEHPTGSQVVGLGVSLGGSILLQAAAAGAGLSAVAADSVGADPSTPYLYIADRWQVSPRAAKALLFPLVEPLFLNARVRYDLKLDSASPVEAVRKVTIPVLLVHGTEDTFIPIAHARRMHEANRRYTQLWEVPGAAHARADQVVGVEYERRVLRFFLSAIEATS